MALKTLQRNTAQTLSMGKENLQKIAGILVGVRTNIGRNRATLYTLRTTDGVKKVWGVPSINESLLDETEMRLIPGVTNCYVEITVDEMEPVGENGALRAVCSVAVDTERRTLGNEKKGVSAKKLLGQK